MIRTEYNRFLLTLRTEETPVARDLFNTGEYGDSLMSARRAVENLCEKVWVPNKILREYPNLPSVRNNSPTEP